VIAISDIDWAVWTPREHSVLCFIFRESELLLIHKKRGLGAGKISAPGGKIEPGESPQAAAIRETQEEVGLTPHDPRPFGELFFQFADGYKLHCTVFRAEGHSGVPMETDEAVPFWTPLCAIPYELMWADDIDWLPHLIARRDFRGFFVFDGDTMLDHQIELLAKGVSII